LERSQSLNKLNIMKLKTSAGDFQNITNNLQALAHVIGTSRRVFETVGHAPAIEILILVLSLSEANLGP